MALLSKGPHSLESKTTPSASFAVGGKTTTLIIRMIYVASSARLQNEIKWRTPISFSCGYGIVAPRIRLERLQECRRARENRSDVD